MEGFLKFCIIFNITHIKQFTSDNDPEPQVIENDIVLFQPQLSGDMKLARDNNERKISLRYFETYCLKIPQSQSVKSSQKIYDSTSMNLVTLMAMAATKAGRM